MPHALILGGTGLIERADPYFGSFLDYAAEDTFLAGRTG